MNKNSDQSVHKVIRLNKFGLVLAVLILMVIFIISLCSIKPPTKVIRQNSAEIINRNISHSDPEILKQDPSLYLNKNRLPPKSEDQKKFENENQNLPLSEKQIEILKIMGSKLDVESQSTRNPSLNHSEIKNTKIGFVPITVYRSDGLDNYDQNTSNKADFESLKTDPTTQHESKAIDSRILLRAGSFIPAIMESGLNSQLPGYAIAQVRRPIYDSQIGNTIAIPQGSKLLLQYESQIQLNQQRLFVKVAQIILPSGKKLIGENQAVDLEGYNGLKDEVQHHYLQNLIGILVNTSGQFLSPIEAPQSISSSTFFSPTTQMINRFSPHQVPPTFIIRPGFLFNILLTEDLRIQDS